MKVTRAPSLFALCVAGIAPTIAQSQTATLDEVTVTARKTAELLQTVPLSVTAITEEQIQARNITSAEDIAAIDPSVIFDTGYSATDNRVTIRGLAPSRGRVTAAILVDGIDVTSESIAFSGGSMLAASRLADIERIEVVKGPQSALYGRSAFAGAINYVTKDPAEVFQGSAFADIGDYGRYNARLSLSGPMTETFGVGFVGDYWEKEGFHRDQAFGQRVGGGEGWGGALSALWKPKDNLSLRVRYEHVDDEHDQPASALIRHNYSAAPSEGVCARVPGTVQNCPFPAVDPTNPVEHLRAFYVGSAPDGGDARINFSPNPRDGGRPYSGSELSSDRVSAILTWDVGFGEITSWTGFTDANFAFLQDGDHDAMLVQQPDGSFRDLSGSQFHFDYENETRQYSQELRFSSKFDGPVNFVAGGLFWKEDANQLSRAVTINCLPAFNNCALGGVQIPGDELLRDILIEPNIASREVEHRSAYLHVSWKPVDSVTLHAEGRFNDEEESVMGADCGVTPCTAATPTSPISLAAPGGVPLRQAPKIYHTETTKSDWFTPRVGIDWQVNPDTLLFASWAQGEKPGGVSTVTGGGWFDVNFDGVYDEFAYGPEELDVYEIGIKREWFDRRLRTNLVAFHQEYTGKQVSAQIVTPSGVPVGRIINAGEAEVDGAELEIAVAITENWTLNLAYTYLDTEYTKFDFTSRSQADAVRAGNCTPQQTANGTWVCLIDASGGNLERVPEHAGSAQLRFEDSATLLSGWLGEGSTWFMEVDVSAQAKRWVDSFNTRYVPASERIDFRVGVRGERWDALVYVNNVTDDDTVLSANDTPGDVDRFIFSPNSFSPTDALAIRMPDPMSVGARFTYRFGATN